MTTREQGETARIVADLLHGDGDAPPQAWQTIEAGVRAVRDLHAHRARTVAEGHGTPVTLTMIDQHWDDDGDNLTTRYLVEGTRNAITAYARVAFAPFSCGPHAGDCCGRMFRPSGATVCGLIAWDTFGGHDDAPEAAVITDRLARDV